MTVERWIVTAVLSGGLVLGSANSYGQVRGDYSGDGDVDIYDAGLILANFGEDFGFTSPGNQFSPTGFPVNGLVAQDELNEFFLNLTTTPSLLVNDPVPQSSPAVVSLQEISISSNAVVQNAALSQARTFDIQLDTQGDRLLAITLDNVFGGSESLYQASGVEDFDPTQNPFVAPTLQPNDPNVRAIDPNNPEYYDTRYVDPWEVGDGSGQVSRSAAAFDITAGSLGAQPATVAPAFPIEQDLLLYRVTLLDPEAIQSGEELRIGVLTASSNDNALRQTQFVAVAVSNEAGLSLLTPNVGNVNFDTAGVNDSAYFFGSRPVVTSSNTLFLDALELLPGSDFTLSPGETLVLDGGNGTLFINQGAVFSGNGVIDGNVINAGLLRIPIVALDTVARTTGGYIEITLPEPSSPGQPIQIPSFPSGGGGVSGGGISGGGGAIISFTAPFVPAGQPTPAVVITDDVSVADEVVRFDASLEVTGTFEQTETGALRLFIAGDDQPGVNYSQLTVGEAVTLDGAIQLVFDLPKFGFFDYMPEVGDTFDLVVSDAGITIDDSGLDLMSFVTIAGAGGVSGLTLSDFDSGVAQDPDDLFQIDETIFRLDLVENDTILRATLIEPFAIPEPTSLMMLAGGVGLLAGRRRV